MISILCKETDCFLKNIFLIYFQRQKKGGGERGREILISCLPRCPNQGLGPQPRHVPQPTIKCWQPLGLQAGAQSTETQQLGPDYFLKTGLRALPSKDAHNLTTQNLGSESPSFLICFISIVSQLFFLLYPLVT